MRLIRSKLMYRCHISYYNSSRFLRIIFFLSKSQWNECQRKHIRTRFGSSDKIYKFNFSAYWLRSSASYLYA